MTNAAEARASLDIAPDSRAPNSWQIAIFSIKQRFKSPAPYLNILGIVSLILLWYATTEYLKLHGSESFQVPWEYLRNGFQKIPPMGYPYIHLSITPISLRAFGGWFRHFFSPLSWVSLSAS